MNRFDKYYDTIDIFQDYLKRDLIGPVYKDEQLNGENPLSRYVMGILWAKRAKDTSVDDYIEDEYNNIENTNKYKPSTMAITVMVGKDVNCLTGQFNFAKYKHSKEDNTGREIDVWSRVENTLKFDFDLIGTEKIIYPKNSDLIKSYNIEISLFARKIFDNGDKLITVVVINNNKTNSNLLMQNATALFQCELILNCNDGFLPIYKKTENTNDIETQTLQLLYSDVKNYGYGHGCSIDWNVENNKVSEIYSTFMPSYEVLSMKPYIMPNAKFLSMKYWESISKKQAISDLTDFINTYFEWRNLQLERGKTKPDYKYAIKDCIDNIDICIKRLKNGIELLNDNNVWNAFKLMNEAMLLQRIKTKKGVNPNEVSWYPFQLAYILQIIPDIADKESDWRENVDLLWFPTGGGKTEAYLGLSAFVIFYRRLTNKFDCDDGVAIIMRYTLRLLTIQQFERASALICACEYIRKKHNLKGGEISIGLWIGSAMTPNKLEDAKNNLDKLLQDSDANIYGGNPMQLAKCPYCGKELDVGCYTISADGMKISCKNNADCEFHNGLPIYVVDEDIYSKKPTFLLSTVDKFARIVWEEKAGELFGVNLTVSPELIIQDELHLISGPLGSLVGAYESIVEGLCMKNGIKPKIIASTATVRNAKAQIKCLYNREMTQFPPNGISITDSFFAKQADRNERAARRYIGMYEPGGSLSDLIIRVFGILLFVKNLLKKQGKDVTMLDQYWTNVGYFNSIKNLGEASSIISDRVNTWINTLIKNKFKQECEESNFTVRDISGLEIHSELTSRKSAKEIKDVLGKLDNTVNDDYCYDYILASNMLSVGIDINRLGVMTMYSQPKTNSEYIQATSRVGRSAPGFVLMMYNASRSRDMSHYEQFNFYHHTFYQYVEPTSVTPYAFRAAEKTLHGVFTALVRHLLPNMKENEAAQYFRKDMAGVAEIRKYILDRIEDVSSMCVDDAEKLLDEYINQWHKLALNKSGNFKYRDFNDDSGLLQNDNSNQMLELPRTLNSLRNVDNSSNIYIRKR